MNQTNQTGEILRHIITLVFVAGIVGWVVVLTVRKAEQPRAMIVRWIITCAILPIMSVMGGRLLTSQTILVLPLLGICTAILIVTWRHAIASLIANPIGSIFDGGGRAPEARPLYSTARARQKRGRYLEAIAEIDKQLEMFPADVEGHLLRAQIQAQDLKDLSGAEATIQQFCEQPRLAPQSKVCALYAMADWHLQIGHDRTAAQQSLEKVIEMMPDTELALGAAQRIAHLNTAAELLDPAEHKKFIVREGPRNLGLAKTLEPLKPAEIDPEDTAAEYVRHLEQHPLDMEARENLAIIYADHYGRLDLATNQLDQMIQTPNQPARLVAHWLNLLADVQVRCGADYETVRQTLQRIVDSGPKLAAAEIARHRLAVLGRELKARESRPGIKLGTYEQRLGLKRGSATNEL